MAFDQQATFAINLEDNTSGAAESAASALKSLQKSIQSDSAALGALQRAMKNLQGGSVVNIALAKELKAKIDDKKNAIARAQASYLQLGGSMSGIKKPTREQIDAFEQIRKNAGALPGPLGGVIGRFESLKGLVGGGAIALGVTAIAAALVALAAGAVAATAALLKYGIAQANARRSELLRIEGLTKMRSWFGLAAGNASEMQTSIDRVAAGSAAGRDKIAEYSTELYRMGLRGENLSHTLEAMAIKSVAQGDAAAHAFAGWAAGAALAGGSVKKLADDVKARLGGIAAKAMLDLDVQAAKMRESFAALFATLKIEGLVKAFSTITQLFSQNTRSGQALKALVAGIFQPMINAIASLAPIAKRFFQGLVIGALLVGIAFLTVRKAWRQTFGESDALKGIDLATIALRLGATAAIMLAGGLAGIAAGIAVVLYPVYKFGKGLLWLLDVGEKVYRYFADFDWATLGVGLADGIVAGIKSKAAAVIDAVKDLGGAAWDAFRERLGIASPSKAFTKLGQALPQGVESGIRRGTPSASRAAADIVPVPSIPAGGEREKPTGKVAGGARAPITVTIGDINVASSAENSAELVRDIKRELQNALELVVIEMGATLGASA